MKYLFLFCFLSIKLSPSICQNNINQNTQLSSGEIYEALEKFNFLGSVLYIAAHPDDENTRLISHFSNGLHARTAYLSLTRGDGGQNLIGTEIQELLGVLRSQELQMARSTDGGIQFFTRANDFGYSKHPDETLRIWDKEKVFDDLIRVIRTFKPDVIINRFDHRTPGKTHGHHTSSAMLSVEAFNSSNDVNVFPYQLETLEPWQVRRQFMNTSWWFYGSRENFEKADKSNLMSVEAGGFYPTLGISNNEISGLARSKHRSQGFGSSGSRGSYQEWLELVNGDIPADKENIFDGINTSWTRVAGGSPIAIKMKNVLDDFDFKNPSGAVPQLLEILQLLDNVEDAHWKKIKKVQLTNIIQACMGLFAEASTTEQQATLGDSVEVEIELTNRSGLLINLNSISLDDSLYQMDQSLETYTENKWYKIIAIDEQIPFSNPYWLDKIGQLGTYEVENPAMRIKPQSDGPIRVRFNINIGDYHLSIEKEVIFKKVDPAIGEIREPFVIIPPATVSFSKEMYLFADSDDQKIEVKVRASKSQFNGRLKLTVPPEWIVSPAEVEIMIPNKSMEQSYSFILSAPENISDEKISAEIVVDGKSYNKSLINIEYDHIPLQTILLPAESKIVKVPLIKGGLNIGYVMGAGDKMPENLIDIGYNVEEIFADQLNGANLNQYDAIVIGVRAYNTIENLKLYNSALFKYAEDGGTLVTQYNTSRNINFENLSPYPLKLSRKRVADETAEIRILEPDHQVLNSPNKIEASDFQGWVQERGLYFPEEWDEQFEAVFSCNDEGEKPLDGSLLIAKHGEGYFVYTTISWFRQLPAGVPGAYRIFANILALSSPINRP